MGGLTILFATIYYQLIVFQGGLHIKNVATVSKREVQAFINELRGIICDESFNLSDFIFITAAKDDKDFCFSTKYTLLDLEFDAYDVLDILSDLKVEEYSETVFDKDNNDPLWLQVFGKRIKNKLVYIKLKIRKTGNKQIVCVSFHYAKNNMSFPYCRLGG